MTPRLNVSLDDEAKKHIQELKTIYEKRLGTKLSLSSLIRMAIFNALVAEQTNQAKI